MCDSKFQVLFSSKHTLTCKKQLVTHVRRHKTRHLTLCFCNFLQQNSTCHTSHTYIFSKTIYRYIKRWRVVTCCMTCVTCCVVSSSVSKHLKILLWFLPLNTALKKKSQQIGIGNFVWHPVCKWHYSPLCCFMMDHHPEERVCPLDCSIFKSFLTMFMCEICWHFSKIFPKILLT